MTTSRSPHRRLRGPSIAGPLVAVLLLVTGSDSRFPTPARGETVPARGETAAGWGRPMSAEGVAPTAYRWPLDGVPRPVRRFDPPPQPWQPGHRGVDLAAGSGAPVRAAGGGTVSFAGPVAGRPVVAVSHPGGLRTTYEPVRPAVATGDRVAPGDPLGVLLAGHPGCPAAACLHWGLRRGEEYLDPLTVLGLGRVRLLPVPVTPTG